MDIVRNEKCKQLYDDNFYYRPNMTEDVICLLETSRGQCYGDSGVPYLILGDSPEEDLHIGTVAWGIGYVSTKNPAVGMRTNISNEKFLRSKICEVAIGAPTYFKCSSTSPSLSSQASDMPSLQSSISEQTSQEPSMELFQQGVSSPPTNVYFSNPVSTSQCIQKPNRCNYKDRCCDSAVCHG